MSGKRKTEGRGQRAAGRNTVRPGNEEFWKAFFALYLNRHQLSLFMAYKLAVASTKKENPFVVIPTIRQAKYQLTKLHPAEISLARYGEKPLKRLLRKPLGKKKEEFIPFVEHDWTEFRGLDELQKQLDRIERLLNAMKTVRPVESWQSFLKRQPQVVHPEDSNSSAGIKKD